MYQIDKENVNKKNNDIKFILRRNSKLKQALSSGIIITIEIQVCKRKQRVQKWAYMVSRLRKERRATQ